MKIRNMNYILYDGTMRNALLPLTYTKPVAEMRVGILTIREKWEKMLGYTTTTLTEDYLEEKYPMVEMEQNIMINASFLPNKELLAAVKSLQANQAIVQGEEIIAVHTTQDQEEVDFESYEKNHLVSDVLQIKNTWDLFSLNDMALRSDFELITEGRTSQPIPRDVLVKNPENVFIEE